MLLPEIKFVPLPPGMSQDDLFEYMVAHGDGTFLVYLRCRYEGQKQWEYLIEACCSCGFSDVLWMSDWWEGQQHVELLGITQITKEIENERNCSESV